MRAVCARALSLYRPRDGSVGRVRMRSAGGVDSDPATGATYANLSCDAYSYVTTKLSYTTEPARRAGPGGDRPCPVSVRSSAAGSARAGRRVGRWSAPADAPGSASGTRRHTSHVSASRVPPHLTVTSRAGTRAGRRASSYTLLLPTPARRAARSSPSSHGTHRNRPPHTHTHTYGHTPTDGTPTDGTPTDGNGAGEATKCVSIHTSTHPPPTHTQPSAVHHPPSAIHTQPSALHPSRAASISADDHRREATSPCPSPPARVRRPQT